MPGTLKKPPSIENPRFIARLKEKQLIPEAFITDLLNELEGNALDVLATLIQSGVGTKRQLCQIWCDTIDIAHVDLEKSLFQPEVVRKLPERFARQHYAIPIYQMGDTVTVATPIPDNTALKQEIKQIIGAPVNLVFALPQDIEWAIENEYRTNTVLYEFFTKIKTSKIFNAQSPIGEKAFEEIAGNKSIQQLHVCLILLGITEYASEIQIDPEADIARIFFIIQEQFHERLQIEKNVYLQLAKNLNAMAKMNDAQKIGPQYSRIIFPTPGKKFDIQFLSLPTEFGEKIFLRLMGRKTLPHIPDLSELYLSVKQMHRIEQQIQSRRGVMLISGPEPWDFSDIAYSILKSIRALNTEKIITVEDSPCRLLKDIEQYQVHPKANISCATAVRSALNLHPTVLYVQNINDPDIIDMMKDAVKSGLFLIAGIAADDVFTALNMTRLGIGAMLTSIVHQQKVQRLCDHCKEKYDLSPEIIADLFIFSGHPQVSAYQAAGCPYCRHTGYHGQIGIQEMLRIDADIQALIRQNTAISDIKTLSKKKQFQSKHYDGMKKVVRGLIPLETVQLLKSR